jgi:predicted  nucleic acid-binding Zn-ribbon protein
MKKAVKKKNVTLDDLAGMVAKGFEGVNKQFEGVEGRFKGIDNQFKGVNQRLAALEEGQEQIKLKLDNVAYRFELIELQKRVERLEAKSGIRYR